MSQLVPCPACNRHVKAESVCAFCGAAVEATTRTEPSERLGRAAHAAFAVTTAAALAAAAVSACGDSNANTVVKNPPPPTDADGGQPMDYPHHRGGGGGGGGGGQNMPYGAPPANGLIKRVV